MSEEKNCIKSEELCDEKKGLSWEEIEQVTGGAEPSGNLLETQFDAVTNGNRLPSHTKINHTKVNPENSALV